ncbi:MAG: class I adenylate cyclase [Desulfobacterales bacterium]|nr:class I adenylate cyclase [Desulfobacterales bacterium]
MDNENNILKNFDFNNFEKNWAELNQNQQSLMFESISEFTPSEAVLPIIAGLSSYHYLLRNKAREALSILQFKMVKSLQDRSNKKLYLKTIQESDCFCSKIFFQIKKNTALAEINFYFQTLIKFNGKGPYYAWKICSSGLISMQTFKTVVQSLLEGEKLLLTDQYLQSNPQIRREWAPEFKKMLSKINNKKEIVDFLSDIFDNNKDIDPFLFNIPLLKNENNRLFEDLHSSDLAKKEKTLKAVSIIYDSLDIDFMIKCLKNKKEKNIRITILKIIEFSSVGTYPQVELTNSLLNVLKKHDSKEAFHAFKALVITRCVPLYKLFIEVIKFRKDILISVLNEISSFSRISFFIIQDVAQNKKEYLKHNSLVFRAYILGVVRKRPERVINILKKFEDHSDVFVRTQVLEFTKKIACFLKEEKRDIENEIESLIQKVNQKQKKATGFFKGFFFSLTDKKLLELKESKFPREFDFEREIIEDTDLSCSKLLNYILFFNASIIKNSNFSQSIIENSFFQNSIIYNVDFTDVKFNSICFDNAVLIDVKASNAQFTNCSFNKASIYNSDFEGCDLQNSTFTGATIVKTCFDRTDLSGVSFVGSKFTFVSFSSSVFNFSDFTGVMARYSKFDDFVENTIITEFSDFNARAFKLNLDSIPNFNEKVISRVEMLIFVEFLYYGERVFLKKNKLSKLIAFDIYKKKQGDLFELIPLLLHANIDFSGKKSLIPKCPHGISKYLPSNEIKKIAEKYLNVKDIKLQKSENSFIEGLYTIGSTGSLAQTTRSDFDFWVIIKDELFTQKMKKNLKLKLIQIEKWADKEFDTEVNFFLLDINKALNNDFGILSFESSGSAQARLLKEEFYRTIIYVAGKLPLWSVLPVSVSIHYYNDINNLILKSSLSSKYINLGDIHGIPSGEYFGASIWHMYKLLKSPFKSVIKMALLEKFINEFGRQPLLCNKIKDIWINSSNQLKLTNCDSYYILISELIKYCESIEDTKTVNLIQICFFLKVRISKKSDFANTLFGIREQFINKLIKEWNMSPKRIFEIGNYKNWEYNAIERFSSTIENYMISKMRSMKISFENTFHQESLITPEERTVLVRNIVVEFSKEKEKIERVLLVSRNLAYFKRVSLQCKELKKKYAWELIVDPKRSRYVQKDALKSAPTIEEIGAWLINNSFYNTDSMINLVPNPTHVRYNDIVKLMKEMHGFFNPFIQMQKSFKSLLLNAEIVAVLVSFNLCVDRNNTKITEYTAIYMNSWNEMFVTTKTLNKGFNSIKNVVADIFLRLGINKFPTKKLFILPKAFYGKIDGWEDYFLIENKQSPRSFYVLL